MWVKYIKIFELKFIDDCKIIIFYKNLKKIGLRWIRDDRKVYWLWRINICYNNDMNINFFFIFVLMIINMIIMIININNLKIIF